VLSELAHHLEDCLVDLAQAGMPEEEAVREAIARLGQVDTIVSAVRSARSPRRLSWDGVTRVATAWLAVGAMSIVTFAAIELPEAPGAKATRLQVAPSTRVGAGHVTACRHDPSTGSRQTERRNRPRCG
jgi:hypothetical protein